MFTRYLLLEDLLLEELLLTTSHSPLAPHPSISVSLEIRLQNFGNDDSK